MADPATTQAKKTRKITVSKVVNGVDTEVEIEVEDTGGPTWGPNDAHRLLNVPVQRVDAPQKVTGTAVYAYDVRLPGMLHGRILRSPHARAQVKSIDLAPAKKIPGVKAVVEGLTKNIMHEGTAVAAVAATTPEIAEDALHAIKVEYEVMPHVVKVDAAMKEGAAKVFPDDEKQKIQNNIKTTETQGDRGAVDAALAECAAVVEAEYRTPMIHHACLETHGIVIDYRGGDQATVYASTQGTHTIPPDAARALGLKQSNVTAIVEHMGGGFGSKFGIGGEGQLACQLSKQAKFPVKMMLTRHDEFLVAGNRSGSLQKLKGGATKDGKLVALLAEQYRLGGVGNGSQAGQPYIYKCDKSFRQVASVHTNEDSSVAFRAPGHPQASFAMESLMDELAHALEMDPLEFRRKNLDKEAYQRQLDRGAKEIGWERRNPKPGASDGPIKRGIGVALSQWGSAGRPQCVVTVDIAKDGAVNVSCGTQDLGTGTRTYMRTIVAEELGLAIDQVKEHIGNSKLGNANASGGSTTTPSLAPAVKDAAYNARVAMAERVAPLLQAKPEEVQFNKGNVTAGEKTLAWKQACAALPNAGLSMRGEWKPDLSSRGVHGCCFADVEVDTETGKVRVIKMVHVQDCGLPLNRLAVESQLNGGMIQGLGQALYEERIMDANLGAMMNPSFQDYKIPGSLEMPEMVPIIDDGDDRQAVIGIGEPPTIPGPGAIANAVFNACGVRIRELPITPDKVLMALVEMEQGTKV